MSCFLLRGTVGYYSPPLPTCCVYGIYIICPSVLCVVMGYVQVGGSLARNLAGNLCERSMSVYKFLATCVSILGGVIAMRPTADGLQGSHPGHGEIRRAVGLPVVAAEACSHWLATRRLSWS